MKLRGENRGPEMGPSIGPLVGLSIPLLVFTRPSESVIYRYILTGGVGNNELWKCQSDIRPMCAQKRYINTCERKKG